MRTELTVSRIDRRVRIVLVSLSILCALLPVVAVIYVVDSDYRRAALAHDAAITEESAARIASPLEEVRRQLDSVAVFIGESPRDLHLIGSFLKAIRGSNVDLLQVAFVSPAGTVVSRDGTPEAGRLARSPSGSPAFEVSDGTPYASVSVRMNHASGSFLTANVSLASLERRLRNLAAPLPGRAFLLADNGRLLLSSDGARPYPSFLRAIRSGRVQRAVAENERLGAPTWYLTSRSVRGTDWTLLVARREVGLLSARFPILLGAGSALFAVVLALIAGLLLSRTSIAPTQRRLQNLATVSHDLENEVRQGEVLLREMHHRVKNDLQILSSMLNLSDRPGINSDDHEVLTSSQNRVHAISLLHELLYKSPNLAGVSIRSYIAELIRRIEISLIHDVDTISIVSHVGDYYFDADTSVACGLLLNELLTNSVKYAFPDGETGVILVRMERIADDRFLLQVQDDGVGLPKEWRLPGAGSMGMRLVSALTEQLGGTVAVESDVGTTWRIEFTAAEVAAAAIR